MTKAQNPESANLKKRLSNFFLQLILPLFLGILILWLVFRGTDFEKIWLIFRDANYLILIFSLVFGLMGNTFRALRWQLLMAPLGHETRIKNIAFAVYGGYAVNFAIPRAGELWRCGMVSKLENVPFAQAVSTMILDRVLDLLSVIIIIFLACFLNAKFLLDQLNQSSSLQSKLGMVLGSVWFYASLMAVMGLVVYLWKFHRHNLVVRKVIDFIQGIRKDLLQIGRMKQKGHIVFYSVMIWVSYFFYFYITLFAFDFTQNLGFTAGLITFVLGSISMAVPTNGGLGAWHAAVIGSLMLYGVSHVSAEAFAFGVFALQSLWVIFCGLIGIVGLSLSRPSSKN
jgi:uncharacterized protein (TIRG00374 family)